MTIWRYKAVPISGSTESRLQQGELAGESAADVRASLRRVGLQVTHMKQVSVVNLNILRFPIVDEFRTTIQSHLRKRRRGIVSEFYDSMATMLDSGMPLLESVETVRSSIRNRRSRYRQMLVDLHDRLRSGDALSEAMAAHFGWFDAIEIAMVRAGQQSGELASTLENLSARHSRTDELSQKLIGALIYPVIIAVVGLGVVVFLSLNTLPELARILEQADIETPALTAGIISFGRFLSAYWLFILIMILCGGTAPPLLRVMFRRLGWSFKYAKRLSNRLTPRVLQRISTASVAGRLAELVGSGIPVVEALRIIAPGSSSAALRSCLNKAAEQIESGAELSDALSDERWFDAEFRQLLDIGQASGDLDVLLVRVADRYARQARRVIDRLAALFEPIVILILAFLVGLVVMAAILPLVKLQEVI